MIYRWIIAAAAFLLLGSAWGTAIGAFGVFVNPLTEDMGWSRGGVSAVYSINIMVAFVVGIFWGWLADRWSVRGVIAVTGLIMGSGLFLTSISNALWQMYLCYGVITAIGLGGTGGPLTAIVVRWFPLRPGMALGSIYAGFGAASAVLPILAERLISLEGWRFGFQGLSILVWGVFFLGMIVLREPPWRHDSPVPASQGAIPESDPIAAKQPGSISSGQEASGDMLALNLRSALRTRPFWTLFGLMFAGNVALNMMLVHLVPRAIDANVASATAVTLLTVMGLVNMVSTMAGGLLGDRFGARRMYLASLLLLTMAMIWLTASGSLWMFYVFTVAFGIGNGCWFPQGPVLAARIFGARDMGSIFAALLLGSGLGGVIGPIIAGYVFDTLDSYLIAFVVGTAVIFAALLLAFTLRDRRISATPKVVTAT